MKKFSGSFTQQEPIPDQGIQWVVELVWSGRLHRYDVTENKKSKVALLETEFAGYQEARFCLRLVREIVD